MKKFIFILLAYFCTIMISAQTYTVYRVKGKVFQITKKGSKAVKSNQKLSDNDVINVGTASMIELLNEKESKKITVRTPGQNTVGKMISSKKNNIIDISSSYMAYMKNQISQKKENEVSDPATITMHGAKKDSTQMTEVVDDTIANIVRNSLSTNSSGSYGFKQMIMDEYEDFRSLCWEQYLDFMRNAWEEYGCNEAEPRPRIEEVAPVPFDEEQKLPEPQVITVEPSEVLVAIDSVVQPMPITKIPEVQGLDEKYCNFTFFGTPCKVRLDNNVRLQLSDTSEDRITEALNLLGTHAFDNTIRDCLEIRYDLQLSDWAYLLMLQTMSEVVYGEGTNEATLLCSYIYLQTGYKMRFATDGQKLYMLVASKHNIYDRNYYVLDGERYYSFTELPVKLMISNVKFPNEESLSLCILKEHKFAEKDTQQRTITSKKYPEVTISLHSNSNLMDFYSTYPSSNIDNNLVTRWMLYANTPIQTSISNQIYPSLRSALEGCSPYEAVSKLLNFVQTGLEYEYDETVWGHDRAFFAEESLYYPFCDCEDRSILFTRLVRDLLGLKCVLLYYPGHLAAAVHIPGYEDGDCVEVKGKQFTVTDPTYIGAGPGCSMPGVSDKKPTVIALGK